MDWPEWSAVISLTSESCSALSPKHSSAHTILSKISTSSEPVQRSIRETVSSLGNSLLVSSPLCQIDGRLGANASEAVEDDGLGLLGLVEAVYAGEVTCGGEGRVQGIVGRENDRYADRESCCVSCHDSLLS